MSARIYIGTSGWNYRHWAGGVFYPAGLKPASWLQYYDRFFDTVEVNNTFYHLPAKTVFEGWRAQTPADFMFSIKAPRFITHMKKLMDPQVNIPWFFENASGLGGKLGVILFQLPPHWGFNPERLKALFDTVTEQNILPGVRCALEIRDESWYVPEAIEVLRAHRVALALADAPGFAARGPLTADFVFVRRHGPGALYASNYPEEALQHDAAQIRAWTDAGRDVYIYFNNDARGYAVRNALRLKELLGIAV